MIAGYLTGIGGSLLSISLADSIALMAQAKGQYTFFSHLKWTPVIALGYAASIMAHRWMNASYFQITCAWMKQSSQHQTLNGSQV